MAYSWATYVSSLILGCYNTLTLTMFWLVQLRANDLLNDTVDPQRHLGLTLSCAGFLVGGTCSSLFSTVAWVLFLSGHARSEFLGYMDSSPFIIVGDPQNISLDIGILLRHRLFSLQNRNVDPVEPVEKEIYWWPQDRKWTRKSQKTLVSMTKLGSVAHTLTSSRIFQKLA